MPPRVPGERPNTNIKFLLFDTMSFPPAPSPLKAEAWAEMMEGYPGNLGRDLLGMIRYGAKLGYTSGDLSYRWRRLERNRPMTEEEEAHVDAEVRSRAEKGALRVLGDDEHVVCSPLGAVLKPAVDAVKKHRTIHNLSWSKDGDEETSVNAGIRSDDVKMEYWELGEMFRELGQQTREDPDNRRGRTLWKVDLKDAYRHVVVVEERDSRLLGFF